MAPIVDIGIASSGAISSEWVGQVLPVLLMEQKNGIDIRHFRVISSALPDHNKNRVVETMVSKNGRELDGTIKKRNELTDSNRHKIVEGFLEGGADWLFFMDDDTAPPEGVITKLLSLGREFIGGLYFLAKPPHNPIAYIRRDDGFYSALWKYTPGQLMQVDSIGMGCTLIHRSVFESIIEGHEVYVRPNGALFAVPKENVRSGGSQIRFKEHEQFAGFVSNGVYHLPVEKKPEDDYRPFPFYSMEYGRTEDHNFCELAMNVGFRPWLDTSIVCDHFKLKAVNRTAHMMMQEQMNVEVDEDEQSNVDRPEREANGS